MQKITIIAIGFLSVALVVLVGLADGRPKDRNDNFELLRLTVTPEKTRLNLGEPLNLRVELSNPTQSEISAHRALDPEYGTIQVYLASPGGSFKRYLGPRWGVIERRPKPDNLAPAESVYGEVTILFNNMIVGRDDLLESNLPMQETGVYRVLVEFYDRGFSQKIKAPVTEVQIDPPTGAEEVVWNAIRSNPELAYFAQTGDARDELGAAAEAEWLVTQYPDASQTRYFALALGKYYQRQNDIQQALRYFEQASNASQKSLLRGQALLELAKYELQLGNFERVERISDSAAEEFTHTSIQNQFSKIATKLSEERAAAQRKRVP